MVMVVVFHGDVICDGDGCGVSGGDGCVTGCGCGGDISSDDSCSGDVSDGEDSCLGDVNDGGDSCRGDGCRDINGP